MPPPRGGERTWYERTRRLPSGLARKARTLMPSPRPELADLLEVDIPPGGKVITVSDRHLPPERTDVSGRSCELLARHLAAEPGPLTVVLAGDVVELLGSPGSTVTDILRPHEDLCAALLDVTARGGQVIYAIGNHDSDLAWDV